MDKGQAVGAVSSSGPVHQFKVEIAHGKHCFCLPKLNWLKINKLTNLCPHLDLHKKSNENKHLSKMQTTPDQTWYLLSTLFV